MGSPTFRQAEAADAFAIMALYQRSGPRVIEDPLFLEVGRMQRLLREPASRIFVAVGSAGQPVACVSLAFDADQGIGKIYRLFGEDPAGAESRAVLRELLRYAIAEAKRQLPALDLVYTTTLTLSPELQRITHECGFMLLGIFPNAAGEDRSGLNGLTAYFYGDVLRATRVADIALHPTLLPLYSVTRQIGGLDALPAAAGSFAPLTPVAAAPVPSLDFPLESISAAQFVDARFRRLKQARSLDTFYPFQTPNLMLIDPREEVEIFARLVPDTRFASILGEHLRRAVDPVALYRAVAEKLRAAGASYLEVINDAGDTEGNEAFLRSGFTPGAYFPALKRHGERRRDFVVFGRSFEYLCRPDSSLSPEFKLYFNAYAQVEFKRYGL